MFKSLFLPTTVFSLFASENNLRRELFSANLHTREYYETHFVDWLTNFNVTVKDGSHFAHMLNNFANN